MLNYEFKNFDEYLNSLNRVEYSIFKNLKSNERKYYKDFTQNRIERKKEILPIVEFCCAYLNYENKAIKEIADKTILEYLKKRYGEFEVYGYENCTSEENKSAYRRIFFRKNKMKISLFLESQFAQRKFNPDRKCLDYLIEAYHKRSLIEVEKEKVVEIKKGVGRALYSDNFFKQIKHFGISIKEAKEALDKFYHYATSLINKQDAKDYIYMLEEMNVKYNRQY